MCSGRRQSSLRALIALDAFRAPGAGTEAPEIAAKHYEAFRSMTLHALVGYFARQLESMSRALIESDRGVGGMLSTQTLTQSRCIARESRAGSRPASVTAKARNAWNATA